MEVYSQPKPDLKSSWGGEGFSVKQEVYGDNGNRKISPLIELSKEELLKKAQEYRKSNIELLEKNRLLSQELKTLKRLPPQVEIIKDIFFCHFLLCSSYSELNMFLMYNFHIWIFIVK